MSVPFIEQIQLLHNVLIALSKAITYVAWILYGVTTISTTITFTIIITLLDLYFLALQHNHYITALP
jgi:hypothetical protein